MAKTSGKFFKVYDWMLDLGLTSDEVLALAYIHTLTQKGLEFYGSVSSLARKLGRGRRTATSLLGRLVKRGLLIKTGNPSDGKPSTYVTCANIEQLPAQNLHTPCAKIAHLPEQKTHTTCANSAHNNSNYNSKSKTVSNTPSTPPAHPTLAEVEEYARQLHAVNPHAFADFFIKFCEANEWRTRNGQGNPITNWRSYIVTSWGHRLNDPFKNYSPTPQRPAPSYRQMTDAEFQNFLKS